MSFADIIKKSVFENMTTTNISLQNILVTLIVVLILNIYIFVAYFLFTQRSFYNRNFNITLVGVSLVTAGIVLALQSSFVISLGMVGALSIIRFRTAIKEPLDLLFLYWAIGIGIICGANLFSLAFIISLIVSLALFLLQVTPIGKSCLLLTVNMESLEAETQVLEVVGRYYKRFQVKTRNVFSDNRTSMIIEIKVKNAMELLIDIKQINCVTGVSLVSHDGEVTF